MKGGVKLIEGIDLTLEGGILHMISHGTLSLVTNHSKHGIIFKIDCEDTPFETMDDVPITSICLKLCILDAGKRTIGEIEKYGVSIKDFDHEVKLQQDIFASVPNVCPGIIEAMIDEQMPTQEPTFFQRILRRLRIQSIDKTLLQKLSTMKGEPYACALVTELINTRLPIGIVAMEMIPQTVSFHDKHLIVDHVSVIAKLLRIFFRTDERGVVGTIHCDCHLGNILKNEKDIVIIDFGTTVDRHTPFTPEQEDLFLKTWGEPLMQVYDKCCSFTLKDIEEVAELLNFFIFMDSIKNEKYGRVQMKALLTPLLPDSTIEPFMTEEYIPKLCQHILDEFKREVPDRHGKIKRLQAEGRMFEPLPKKSRGGKRKSNRSSRRK